MRSKRDQIIAAALNRYREAGLGGSTLKDVAEASGVPLGNLYYYFRTKDELVVAVLEACEQELLTLLGELAPLPPRAWLERYFEWLLQDPAAAARLGCPFGSLAAELRALGDPAAPRAAAMVQRYYDAVRAQGAALSGGPGAIEELFMAVQGTYVVARILGNPPLFQAQIGQLRERFLGRA
ncbi:TetR/AcrR family transcriptional regulator [Deinococcus sonorensis]|uniref:TetR/AcrR family transcriptional regulator n=2 Tax=Deinococcus sonorensis TaxID=309891 RepID=A0AAU7U518_9DEIO